MAPSPAHRGVESNNHRPYRVRQLIQFGGHRAAFSLAHAHAHRLVLLEAQGVLRLLLGQRPHAGAAYFQKPREAA